MLRPLCAPATDIAITIPLPPIADEGCPLPVYPASPVLDALFGARNLILPQPSEAALNAHLGASALCSPILDQLLTATRWLAAHTGNAARAEAYITAMIRAYLPKRAAEGDLVAALKMLSTEGGLNGTLRAAMSPATDDLRRGLDGFRPRLGLDAGTGEAG
jgi:pyrroline-5-carboxylate reductase